MPWPKKWRPGFEANQIGGLDRSETATPKSAGAPREGDPLAATWPERDIVAAFRKLDRLLVARKGEQGGLKITPVVLARGGEALGLKHRGGTPRTRQCNSAAGKAGQKFAAVERHGLISIHGIEAEGEARTSRNRIGSRLRRALERDTQRLDLVAQRRILDHLRHWLADTA